MIVADANIVIAASNPSDVHHAEATAIVLEHGPDGIVLHSLTLAEVLVGPARAGAHVRARHQLEAAGFRLSAEGEPPPEDLALVRATAGLKMPDACVLALAELLEAPLATFDARLANAARARGITVHGSSN